MVTLIAMMLADFKKQQAINGYRLFFILILLLI